MIDKTGLTAPFSLNKDDEDMAILLSEAVDYIQSFTWCDQVKNLWLAFNFDYLVVVVLAEIDSSNQEVDSEIWLVVGDIPTAYIDVESAPTKEDVLPCYVDVMQDWVDSVIKEENLDDCYPVEVPSTIENAQMLSVRLNLIRSEIIPAQ